ncbi:MAG: Fe-S-containing hydro-lyase [Clostridia bacterium]|nr:Fe-S-containing hydro-lyase [Clostridia bacterium]
MNEEVKRIELSNLRECAQTLSAGDSVSLTGTIYTARDAAHKRLTAMLDEGQALPFDLRGAVIYYAGPTPERPGQIIGSLGPTTSGRMDPYSERFLSLGLSGMIGKGDRREDVCAAIEKYGAVYFIATGGAGALLSKCVRSCEVIAFDDLGCESVKRLYVEDFPAIVAIDAHGGNIYKTGREKYREILSR